MLYAVISTVLAIVGIVFAIVLPSLVSIHGSFAHTAQVAALIAVLTLALELPLTLFANLLKGQQRFDIFNASSLLSIVVYASLVGAVLTQHRSITVLALAALAGVLVRLVIPAALVRRELPELRLSLRLVRRSRLRELASFSAFASAGQIAGKIVFYADTILIGLVLGSISVAVYGVALRLFTLAAGIAGTGTDVLFPAFSELEGRGDARTQLNYVPMALRAGMCVVVLVTAPLLLVPSWVIEAWLGPGFRSSVAPLVLLAATLYFSQATSIMAQFLLGRGRPGDLARVQSVFGIANVIATLALLAAFRSIWVAALATLLLEGLVGAVALPRVVARDGIAYTTLARAWARPVAAGIPAVAVTLLPAAMLWHDSRSLPGLLAVGGLWVVVYAAAAWFLALGPRERAFVRRTLARARGDIDPIGVA
jgi:O-antigen/teichoic acid export membrane protein